MTRQAPELVAEQAIIAHTRTLALIGQLANVAEGDVAADLLRILQAGAQQRDEAALALRASAGGELSENDVVTISDGTMSTKRGRWHADIFRSSNDVLNGGAPLMTMQVYGPEYEEADYVSFYFERDTVQELHILLGRFLALPVQTNALIPEGDRP